MSVGVRPSCRSFVLPAPRGPFTEALFAVLAQSPDDAPVPAADLSQTHADPLLDDDLQLALFACYELHYAGVAGIDERWEWAPSLLAFRGALERRLEFAMTEIVPATAESEAADVGDTLLAIVAADEGPPLSRYAETKADLSQMLEHVVHRSAYQLKEADPHSWAIPRLDATAKAALLEIQFDEYGAGRAQRMHSVLFADTMRALGLDASYGAYVELLPAVTLAGVNWVSMCGLHRRLRGALVGHLAVFEMTSSVPNRRYANAWRRLGHGADVTAFYDEHVEADAVHENIATWDLADRLARSEPDLAPDIVFGARALLELENRWAGHLLDSWGNGDSSLLGAFVEPTSR